MSLTFNNPLVSRSLTTPPPAKDELPGQSAISFKDMTDNQRREFLTAESQRLQQKPDRSADENTKLALIMDFLDGALGASGLEELTKLYSPGAAANNTGRSTPPDQGTRPEIVKV